MAQPPAKPEGLLLVGCGKMGGALLKGWLDGEYSIDDVVIVEPNTDAIEALGLPVPPVVVSRVESLPDGFTPRVVVFAVKPQLLDDTLPHYAGYVREGTVFLSIAAGKPLLYFEHHLSKKAAVVRAMPNTPAAIGRGITAAISNALVSARDRSRADILLSAVGQVVWLTDEAQMDAVTALSGSGPAYVFHLVECMAAAGVAAGLPAELAMELARATVAGAGELLYESEFDAATLCKNVTSPGGTTEAALGVLMGSNNLQKLMTEAIAAGVQRSIDLAH
jgi:pyrroline-5-carboxylate reductase